MDYFATISQRKLVKVNSKIRKATHLSGVDKSRGIPPPACCNIICAISGSMIVVGRYRTTGDASLDETFYFELIGYSL